MAAQASLVLASVGSLPVVPRQSPGRSHGRNEKGRPRPSPFRSAEINDYLRVAQAYMLISMPTQTSAIFGVFQDMGVSLIGVL